MKAIPKHQMPATIRLPVFLGAILLFLLVLFSVFLRQAEFARGDGAPGLEATYHVLFTVEALNENPPRLHWYLPTVSLAGERDKHIPWGAAIPAGSGDYFYTSFYSPAFLAPYAWFKLADLPPTIENLAYFNVLLGGLGLIFIYLLLAELLALNGYGRWQVTAGALLGSLVGVFSSEALLSHGVLYWAHSLYQPILACSLYLFFKCLTCEGWALRLSVALLIVAAFVGPLVEWSGYVFNAGMVVILWWNRRVVSGWLYLAIAIMTVTLLAAITMVLHYAVATGFYPAIEAFGARFAARSTTEGSVWDLLKGYGASYGGFLLGPLLLLAVYRFTACARGAAGRTVQAAGTLTVNRMVLLAASMPLLENFLLLQHAVQFSFDRLKFVFPAALISAFLFVSLQMRWRVVLSVIVVLAALQNYSGYRARLGEYSQWLAIDAGNRQFLLNLAANANLDCAVLYANIGVRGYTNLLFQRGIYEYRSLHEGMDLLRRRNACMAIFLDGSFVFTDLQRYSRAVVTYPDGSHRVVTADSVFKPAAEELVDSFYQTDAKYWQRGVSRQWPGFYLPNTERFVETFSAGRRVKFANGEMRTVMETRSAGSYLEVIVDGELLDPAVVGVPYEYDVIDKVLDR